MFYPIQEKQGAVLSRSVQMNEKVESKRFQKEDSIEKTSERNKQEADAALKVQKENQTRAQEMAKPVSQSRGTTALGNNVDIMA